MLSVFSRDSMASEIETRRRVGRRARRGGPRRIGRHPHLELLETRITPSTWTGAGGNADWMTPDNWSGDVAPQSGASLDFPAGVSNLATVNNFPTGTQFGSIKIDASGYALTGNGIGLTQGISTTYTSGTSTDSIPAQLSGKISAAAGGKLVINGALTGVGPTVTGGGTVDFAVQNVLSGTTTIDGAGTTLLVDGSVGAVQVDAGTTLGGSGTVGDVNSIGGTIIPNDGGGPLQTDSLTLDGASTFAPVLTGPNSVASGQVTASGPVTLAGTLNASVAYAPGPGDQLTIISNNSGSPVTGTFTGLPQGSTFQIGVETFQINYQGGSGNDVVLTFVPYTTTTTISTTTPTATYGQPVDVTAVVSTNGGPGLTGTVDFYDGNPSSGGTLLGHATVGSQDEATFSTKALDVTGSPHQLYAAYSGSNSDTGSTTTQPVSVAITPASLTASLVGTVSKTYDGTTTATLSSDNFALSGVLGGDNVSLSFPTSGTYDTKDVGSRKTVSVDGLSLVGANPSNYTLANDSVSGPVGMIVPASVTVTGLTAQNKVYDGTTSAVINTSSATLSSGVISGDDVTLVTAGAVGAFVNSSVGTNEQVDVTGLSLSGTDAGNYTIATPAIATASITPAPLTVTANPATMVYGGLVPTLTYTATGLVGRDTVTTALTGSLATTATSKSSVGDYPITQGTLTAVDGDYTITFTGSTLSITPAPLTITANDVSTVYGAPLPALTASYSGFVNNDTAASLTTPPSLTTPATATSPVGTYPISVSGASSSDYTITYVPGTITIAKAGSSVGVSESLSTSVVGQGVTFTVQVAPISPSTGHPTGTVTFFADGNSLGTAAVDPATGQASISTASLGSGSHAITADYSGDSNYTPSQSGPTAETVSASATETVLTTTAVRTKRGRIVKVMIRSQVIAISPVAGTPTGVVTYYRGVHPIASMALSDGSAVDTLKSTRALKKQFTVRYSGVASFDASTSPTVVVTKKSLAMSGRPATAFLKRR